MHCLMMGIGSEKYILRHFLVVNTIECTYTNDTVTR